MIHETLQKYQASQTSTHILADVAVYLHRNNNVISIHCWNVAARLNLLAHQFLGDRTTI